MLNRAGQHDLTLHTHGRHRVEQSRTTRHVTRVCVCVCLRLPSAAFGCHLLPSVALGCFRLPSGAFGCLRLPLVAFGCIQLPSIAFGPSFVFAIGCLWLPLVAFRCLRLPLVAFSSPTLVSTSLVCLHSFGMQPCVCNHSGSGGRNLPRWIKG